MLAVELGVSQELGIFAHALTTGTMALGAAQVLEQYLTLGDRSGIGLAGARLAGQAAEVTGNGFNVLIVELFKLRVFFHQDRRTGGSFALDDGSKLVRQVLFALPGQMGVLGSLGPATFTVALDTKLFLEECLP